MYKNNNYDPRQLYLNSAQLPKASPSVNNVQQPVEALCSADCVFPYLREKRNISTSLVLKTFSKSRSDVSPKFATKSRRLSSFVSLLPQEYSSLQQFSEADNGTGNRLSLTK